MKRYIWRVKWIRRFSSSTGMKPYHNDDTLNSIVATESDRMGEIQQSLAASCSCQESVFEIQNTEFLGIAL